MKITQPEPLPQPSPVYEGGGKTGFVRDYFLSGILFELGQFEGDVKTFVQEEFQSVKDKIRLLFKK